MLLSGRRRFGASQHCCAGSRIAFHRGPSKVDFFAELPGLENVGFGVGKLRSRFGLTPRCPSSRRGRSDIRGGQLPCERLGSLAVVPARTLAEDSHVISGVAARRVEVPVSREARRPFWAEGCRRRPVWPRARAATACRAADELRANRQPQSRKSDGLCAPTHAPRPCGRGRRVTRSEPLGSSDSYAERPPVSTPLASAQHRLRCPCSRRLDGTSTSAAGQRAEESRGP
jgi:hypothetical protein